jgi:hypothetical protein
MKKEVTGKTNETINVEAVDNTETANFSFSVGESEIKATVLTAIENELLLKRIIQKWQIDNRILGDTEERYSKFLSKLMFNYKDFDWSYSDDPNYSVLQYVIAWLSNFLKSEFNQVVAKNREIRIFEDNLQEGEQFPPFSIALSSIPVNDVSIDQVIVEGYIKEKLQELKLFSIKEKLNIFKYLAAQMDGPVKQFDLAVAADATSSRVADFTRNLKDAEGLPLRVKDKAAGPTEDEIKKHEAKVKHYVKLRELITDIMLTCRDTKMSFLDLEDTYNSIRIEKVVRSV